jgi:hypothetical protein
VDCGDQEGVDGQTWPVEATEVVLKPYAGCRNPLVLRFLMVALITIGVGAGRDLLLYTRRDTGGGRAFS